MKIIQSDQHADNSQETGQPPTVDNRFSFYIEDQEMIEYYQGEETADKGCSYQWPIGFCDGGDRKGDKEEERQ